MKKETDQTDPPLSNTRWMDTMLTGRDREDIMEHEKSLRYITLGMSGQEIRERIARMEDEIRRMENMKQVVIRMKRITMSTMFGTYEDEQTH